MKDPNRQTSRATDGQTCRDKTNWKRTLLSLNYTTNKGDLSISSVSFGLLSTICGTSARAFSVANRGLDLLSLYLTGLTQAVVLKCSLNVACSKKWRPPLPQLVSQALIQVSAKRYIHWSFPMCVEKPVLRKWFGLAIYMYHLLKKPQFTERD